MRTCAILDNMTVVEVKQLDDAQMISESSARMLIDIEDMNPRPAVGWVLEGNSLKVPVLTSSGRVALIMDMRFTFGNSLADSLVKRMSIRNIDLIATGQTMNISAVISAFSGIEAAMRKCAIPTAKAGIQSMVSAYPEYAEEFQFALSEINNYLAAEAAM